MKHKHKWQISHTNKEFSSLGFSGTLLNGRDGLIEYAYIICEECGEVRKKKVKESKEMNNEEIVIELKKEVIYLKRMGLPDLAKALNRLIPLIRP